MRNDQRLTRLEATIVVAQKERPRHSKEQLSQLADRFLETYRDDAPVDPEQAAAFERLVSELFAVRPI